MVFLYLATIHPETTFRSNAVRPAAVLPAAREPATAKGSWL